MRHAHRMWGEFGSSTTSMVSLWGRVERRLGVVPASNGDFVFVWKCDFCAMRPLHSTHGDSRPHDQHWSTWNEPLSIFPRCPFRIGSKKNDFHFLFDARIGTHERRCRRATVKNMQTESERINSFNDFVFERAAVSFFFVVDLPRMAISGGDVDRKCSRSPLISWFVSLAALALIRNGRLHNHSTGAKSHSTSNS